MKDYLPIFNLLTGFTLGLFYGTLFTFIAQRVSRRRAYLQSRAYDSRDTAPPSVEEVAEDWIDEIEERLTHD